MNFGLFPTDGDLFSKDSASINNDMYKLMMQVSKMYATTGSEHFKKQLDELKKFVADLPDDKCSEWGIVKKQFEIQPTPIPQEQLYGLLQCIQVDPKIRPYHDMSETFSPEYTVKIYRDLEQGKRTEAASIVQCRKLVSNNSLDTDVFHPTLYRIKFEPIDKHE